jgi:Fe-Mn family superoxide dismutase
MSQPYTRREFLATAATGATLAALSPETFSANTTMQETTMTQSLPSAFAASHEIKPLPFDPAKLDGFSEKLIRSHWENNYGGSVKALNAVKQRLVSFIDDASIPPFIYNDLKREHLMRTGILTKWITVQRLRPILTLSSLIFNGKL